MKPPALSVRCPDPRTDAAGVIELVSRTFGTYARLRAASEAWYVNHSHYDWEASAVGLSGGALVTHWGVWGYRMRVGRATVRCAGIGAVATAADLRGRGLMMRTAPHALARMRARGYHLSILFGKDDYYDRYGYAPAWPESRWRVRLSDLPRDLPRVAGLRRLPAAPAPGLIRLHNRWSAGLTGTAVRPTYPRWWHDLREGVERHAWGRVPGRPEGHVVVHADASTLVCTEATGMPDAALAALARLCREKTLPDLRFEALPYRSALAARLRTLNCKHEQQYAANGEAMVRLVDLAGCLGALAPELSARLAASELSGYRGTLTLHGPEGAAGLVLAGGAVRAVAPRRGQGGAAVRGGWALARLLLGSDEPLEVCEAGRLRLTGDAARLVRVLFPAQHPQLHHADRF